MQKNRFVRAAALLAMAAALCGGTAAAAPAAAKKARAAGGLEPLARRLDAKIGELVDPGALLDDAAFVKVFEAPAPLRPEAEALLTRGDVSENQKLIVVYSMQRLPLNDYVAFLTRLLDLRRSGKVTQTVYANGAFPPYSWSTALAENYRDPAVVAFLKKARAIASDDDKTMIDETLSGRAAEDVKTLREEGQLQRKPAAR